MIRQKIIWELSSRKEEISIKNDPGDVVSTEPSPFSQSLARGDSYRRRYPSEPEQRRD